MSNFHIPVMLKEAIQYLEIKPGHWYIDCNLGGGGHTARILELGGKVIGIDLDPDSINEVSKKYDLKVKAIDDHLEASSENIILYQSNFSNLDNVIKEIGHSGAERSVAMNEVLADAIESQRDPIGRSSTFLQDDVFKISGILFDLGVSSYQLETANRGFSFNKDAPLDMRMNPSFGATAADLVNGLHEKELAELFWKLGEENFSKLIAKKIVESRKTKLIETTNELVSIITSVRRKTQGERIHPATRVFQALRIAVNDELNSLKEALPKALEILSPGGRIAVISFHSLEDRIVKNYFRDWEEQKKVTLINKKPIELSEAEVSENPRARSGKLRVIEKNSN